MFLLQLFFVHAYLHRKSLAANNTAKLISELYYVLVLEREEYNSCMEYQIGKTVQNEETTKKGC